MTSWPQPLPREAPRWHRKILWAGWIALALAWAAVILVDLAGLVDLEDRLRREGREPVFWLVVFGEGGPVEKAQWFVLGSAAVAAAYLAGVLRGRGQRGAARFWTILAVGLLLMLIEDAGNVRHHLGSYVGLFTDELSREHRVAVALERTLLWVIGAVLLFALLYRRELPWRSRPTRRLLCGGYAAYGAAALGSVTRDFFSWYERAGDAVLAAFGGRLGEISAAAKARGLATGHELIDSVFEESLELLGATLLCAAVAAYAAHLRHAPSIADGDPPPRSLFAQLRGRSPAAASF